MCVCVFHFPASKKNKVKDQLVAKLKWKQTEGRTRPIALRRSSPLTPSIKVNHIVDFNKARAAGVTVSDALALTLTLVALLTSLVTTALDGPCANRTNTRQMHSAYYTRHGQCHEAENAKSVGSKASIHWKSTVVRSVSCVYRKLE